MFRFCGLPLALLSCTSVLAGVVQKPGLVLPLDARSHRDAAEAIFVKSYESYRFVHTLVPCETLLTEFNRKFAFGHDDLEPISGTFDDGRNGWGATIVDALTTLVRLRTSRR